MQDLVGAFSAFLLFLNLMLTGITNFRVGSIREDTNGLKDQLVREVRRASYAKGRKSVRGNK